MALILAFGVGFLVAALARPRSVTHLETTTLAGHVVPAACLDALTAAQRFFRPRSPEDFRARLAVFEATAARCRTITATRPSVAVPPACREAIAAAHEIGIEERRDKLAVLFKRYKAAAARCRAE